MCLAGRLLPAIGLFWVSLGLAEAVFASDPVERWAAAVGGRDKLAEVNAIYREGTIEVNGGVGTLRVWHTADGRYRKEESGGSFTRIETFDGVDALVKTGAAPVQRLAGAQLARAISQAYANTNAIFFAFFPERRRGELVVEGEHTVVLKPAGGIDWRVELDPTTWLPTTMLHAEASAPSGSTSSRSTRSTGCEPKPRSVARPATRGSTRSFVSRRPCSIRRSMRRYSRSTRPRPRTRRAAEE